MLTLKEPTDVTLEEYVTDRFLCTGGSAGYQDAIACKGLNPACKLYDIQNNLTGIGFR